MNRRTFLHGLALPLAAAPAARAVTVESDGMLAIDGARTFILGLYQLPKLPDAWKQVHDAGFNLVHLGADAREYDRAREYGVYGWSSVGSIAPDKRAADEARIRKIVGALKDHPALLFWETEDEPTFVWKKRGARVPPENIIEAYRFVKRIDPAHPFYLNHSPTNLEQTLARYNAGCDIMATDVYPVIPHGIREQYALWPNGEQGDLLDSTISQVGQYADKMRRVAGPARAVFMVLQAFAWEMLRQKDRQPEMVLYPTLAQTRFMAYQSIAHGANGLVYWGIAYAPAESPMWGHLRAIAGELRGLRAELAARAASLPLKLAYHDTGHSLDRGIEWIAKPSAGGGVLLVAVNADRNPVEVTFGGLERFRAAEVLFESRTVAPAAFRETFEPFGVHVYRLR